MIGPCAPWIEPDDVFACGACAQIAVEDQDADLAELVVQAASEWLYFVTGRRFNGGCETIVRPCGESSCWPPVQTLDSGFVIVPTGDCGCGSTSWDTCSCPSVATLRLPGPAMEITEILIDGAVLAPSTYRLDERRYLVRLDGGQWPFCQNLAADPETDTATFSVEYVRGTGPGALGELAARELACHLYRGCSGDADCDVPVRVTNLVRQGVTMQFVRPDEIGVTDDGRVKTGLENVQLFLAAFPPARRGKPSIASPDIGRAVRRV